MSLLLNDPCNNFTAAPWTVAGSPSVTPSGHTGNGFSIPAGSSNSLAYAIAGGSQTDTLTVGFWINFGSAGLQPGTANGYVALCSDAGATTHLTFRPSAGFVAVYCGGTLVDNQPCAAIAANSWIYVEWQAKLSATVGTCVVKVNGTTFINKSNINTKNGGTKTVWDTVKVTGMGVYGPWVVDDIYIRNDATFGVAPMVNVWNGSAFVSAPILVWNGSAFVNALAVKTWNGSAFV
jgi:hypothetical protein